MKTPTKSPTGDQSAGAPTAGGPADAANAAATPAAREVVLGYFQAVRSGDIKTITALFDEHVSFWVPPSLPDGVTFRGKSAVLRLFTESVGLYDADAGLDVELGTITAEGERVAVELTIRGRAAADGAAYFNHYHFLFRVRDGRIVEIREHLDSLYAYRTLFIPARMTRREDCPWVDQHA